MPTSGGRREQVWVAQLMTSVEIDGDEWGMIDVW